MKDKLNYKILEIIKPSFDRKNKYLVIKVKDTVFAVKETKFNEYVLGCNQSLWKKVNNWIDKYLIPYMIEEFINYNSFNSDEISTRAEFYLGENIPHELITYILAARGIKGENKKAKEPPVLLYYPLSSEFKTMGGML